MPNVNATLKPKISGEKTIPVKISGESSIDVTISAKTSTGTYDFNKLINHPYVNDEEVVGHKTLEDYGVKTLTNLEIKEIFDRVFNKGGE